MADKRNMFYGASPHIFEKAKELRNNMTKHELLLWEELKANKLLGLRFKAQHPIGSFIADFYCHKLKLVIEIDGNTHESVDAKEYDKGREEEMKEFEIKTIRFSNKDLEQGLSHVLHKIKTKCLHRGEELNLIFPPTLKGVPNLNLKQPITPFLKGGTVSSSTIESPLQGVGGKKKRSHE